MYCYNCGHELGEGALFCAECGTRQDVDEAVQELTQAPEPELEIVPEPEPEIMPEPEPEPQPEIMPEPEPEPQPEIVPQVEPVPEPAYQAEPIYQQPVRQAEPVYSPQPARKGKGALIAVLVVIVVLLLGTVGFLLWSRSQGKNENEERIAALEQALIERQIEESMSEAETNVQADIQEEEQKDPFAPDVTPDVAPPSEWEEEEEAEVAPQYILPESDARKMERSDLEDLSAEELRLARNEIYARRGRRFQDETIQSYFESKDWYEGSIDPSDFTEDMLNEVETYNRDFITEYEKEMGYR